MSDTPRRTNFDQLQHQVVSLLAAGAFRPGERIGIKELADRLAVSPTPVREVMSKLVGRDMVEERRSEGYYLADLDARRIADLYSLHHHCIDLALKPPPPRLRSIVCGMPDVWAACDALVEATGDIVLLQTRRYLDDRLRLLRRCEAELFDDMEAEAERHLAVFRDGDLQDRRRAVACFHRRRISAARHLAYCVGRRATSD